ncbi:MAG TPA: glycosyltransferase [Cyclobacteriaceae bacterium]|nr:glycosyltransferase [Cyclobacteriaceae bacterium]HRJ83292.1 glycosyltransferase [Cyclobacteriaceae bacterium]
MRKTNHFVRVAVVLSSVPAYSETFFTSKINGLSKLGYRIVVFARGNKKSDLNCAVVQPYPVYESSLLRLLSMCFVLPLVFVRAPLASLRLWQLEKKDGLSLRSIFKSLYLNSHILPYKLNWLHFGFSAVGIGRENVARAIGANLAVSFRGYDINVYPLKHKGCYDRLWTKVDKVHAISHYLVNQARTLGLADSTPFHIITPAVSDYLPVKTDFQFKKPLQVITVARLTWIKGLSIALQAVAQLIKMGVQIHYTIIGDGSDREYLLHEIRAMELTDHVTLAGKLPHADTLNQMQQSDIYLQPSLNEGFCNAVLEAQAMGCLCIASRVGGLPENIEHGVTGWLFEPRSPGACAEALLKLLDVSMEERIIIASQARQRVALHFQMDNHLLQWRSFYES